MLVFVYGKDLLVLIVMCKLSSSDVGICFSQAADMALGRLCLSMSCWYFGAVDVYSVGCHVFLMVSVFPGSAPSPS